MVSGREWMGILGRGGTRRGWGVVGIEAMGCSLSSFIPTISKPEMEIYLEIEIGGRVR